MPTLEDGTPWQRAAFEQIVAAAGVDQPAYNGVNDDHYKFAHKTVYAYIKVTSARTRTLPPAALKVIVKAASWNATVDGLESGNNWHGPESRHLFVTERTPERIEQAADLLRRARAHA